jgi:hypothetical protein
MKIIVVNNRIVNLYEDDQDPTESSYTEISVDDDEFFEKYKDYENLVLKYEYDPDSNSIVKEANAILEEFRVLRDEKLKESDEESKAVFPDLWDSQTEDHKEAWATYRQELRDLPDVVEVSEKLLSEEYEWPDKPA